MSEPNFSKNPTLLVGYDDVDPAAEAEFMQLKNYVQNREAQAPIKNDK